MASENLGGSYDIILSAETIYNLESQQQLLDCIKQVSTLLPATCLTCCTMLGRQTHARRMSSDAASHVHCMQAIKPPTGIVYIAAKTYYFGVGGGTTSFKKMLKRDGMLEVLTVATFDDGDGNKREILKLKFPDHIIPYFL